MLRPVASSSARVSQWLLALFALLLIVGCQGAGAATTVGFAVGTAPAPGATGLASGGNYFAPSVAPGSSYRSAIVIANANHNAVTVLIYAVDGLTSPGSGSAYSNSGASLNGAGRWITLERTKITLAPQSRATVGFTVTVPVDAPPGGHLGGIAVEGTSPSVAQARNNVQVNVVTRSVIGVLVNVPGHAVFSATIGTPKITLGAYKIGTITVPVHSTGGMLGKPVVTVTLSNSAGYHRSLTRQLDTILPGDSTVISIYWPDKLAGRYLVEACVHGGGLAASSCKQTTALAPTSARTPSSNSGPFPVHPTTTAPVHGSSTPLGLLIAVVVLGAIVLVGGGVLLGSRAGRRRGGPKGEAQ